MPLPEIARRRVEHILGDFCEARVPRHARDQVRLELDIRGNAVTIFELRAPWSGDTDRSWTRGPVAQFRYDDDSLRWTLYWRDRDQRWFEYDRIEPSIELADLLEEVNADPAGIFWG